MRANVNICISIDKMRIESIHPSSPRLQNPQEMSDFLKKSLQIFKKSLRKMMMLFFCIELVAPHHVKSKKAKKDKSPKPITPLLDFESFKNLVPTVDQMWCFVTPLLHCRYEYQLLTAIKRQQGALKNRIREHLVQGIDFHQEEDKVFSKSLKKHTL